MKPWMLEVCAGEGGATLGLQRAGWRVLAVDNDPNRLARNPADEKWCGDAFEALERFVGRFQASWGGWPCQGYTAGTRALRAAGTYSGPDRLIAAGREAQQAAGVPYVIENVEAAKPEMVDPVLLCGRQFGLTATDEDGGVLVLDRHRLIESDVFLMGNGAHPAHDSRLQVAGVYGGARTSIEGAKERGGGYTPKSERVQCELLGIEPGWMTGLGRRLCIPPVYAKFIGEQLLEALGVAA